MMHKPFLKRFFLTSLVLVLFIITLNYFFDPFGIYALTPIKNLNHQKYETEGRLTVALKMIEHKPKTVVFGTSRVLRFNREMLQRYSDGEAFYNAGFAGASFDEIYAYFLHALYLQPELKRVILGIDLVSFNINRKPQKDFKEERLQRNDFFYEDLKNTLFSYKALTASYECFHMSFFNKEKENVILQMGEKKFLRSWLDSEENYKNYAIDPEKIKKFQCLVETCKKKSIDLKVFVNPVKAMYLEFYIQNGLWSHLENLKRQLCAIYPLFDFSGYNPITTETLESEGNALYHECSHFTAYTSNLLLKRMFNEPSIIDSIGYLLTPENVENTLAEILSQRSEWLQK